MITCPRHGSRFDLTDGHVVRWTKWSGITLSLAKILRSPRPIKIYQVQQQEDRGNQGARVADPDPPDEVDDGETPADRDIDSPSTHTEGEGPDDPDLQHLQHVRRRDVPDERVHLDDQEIALTAKEFDVLAYLAEDPGAVRRRTEILEHVWEGHWYGATKTVDAHVAAIRKKLGDSAWIEAVRGVGFRLGSP